MAIAKVEPLTTARALRGPFDYRLPETMSGVGVGTTLLVPFGHRRVLGVVVEIAETSDLPPERLAEPIEALEAGATPELVRLGLWVAREYCSTPARGLELVLPPGGTRGRTARPRLELRARITDRGVAALAGEERLGNRQREVLLALAARKSEPGVGERATLRRLEGRGLVTTFEERAFRRPAMDRVGAAGPPPRLTSDQRKAVSRIVAGLDGHGPRELLLHGVTGSGKTEVYLAATEAALERGRGVIALVPEIGLTPQAVSRFAARFGDSVALLHSRLSAGQRRDEWERLRSGQARVCVGPRSAVFAPVGDLGLIVIDEEQDPSYKQEGDPRYDARAVARHRAAIAGAALVAGTATPRPESWSELDRAELPERADGARLPVVEIVDMRTNVNARGPQAGRGATQGPLHPRTWDALARVRADGGKAIVLVNRRGWAPFLSCRACGHAWGCPSCDVSLVVHRSPEALRCHHCGHAEPIPDTCAECGSVAIARHGAGSERVSELIAEAVAPMPVFRLDSDSAGGVGAHGRILGEFDRASAGVLVGTQMVAKGHDFPDVVLSVILDADASLRFPDFRAEERTFALVAQLAGRSGRGARAGRVLVQTLAPEATAIRCAAAHDAPRFLAGELERRRELRYPPFGSLIRVDLSGPDAARCDAVAGRLRDLLAPALPDDADVLGPAPRFRVRGQHRRQLLVKADARQDAVAAVRDAVERMASSRELRGVALSVDVDPQ